jgi:hypothetical protein
MITPSSVSEREPNIHASTQGDLEWADPARIVRHRRRMRLARFIVFETIAIAVLFISVVAGVSERFVAESLTPLFRVLPITAAIVAAILPIFFFGDPKRTTRLRG